MTDQSSNTPMPAGNGALKRTGRPSRGRIRRPSWSDIAAFLVKRYGALPAWVLLVQIFLAAGWMRAAAAHGLSLEWWSGREVAAFRAEHSETAIDWYRLTILNGPVSWAPVAIAGIVIVGQLTVGALLGSQYRPLLGLGIGAFLNINFVLARRAGAAVNSVDESAWRRSPARLEGGEPESFSDVARRATGTGDIDAEAGVPDVSSAVRIHPPPEHRRDR